MMSSRCMSFGEGKMALVSPRLRELFSGSPVLLSMNATRVAPIERPWARLSIRRVACALLIVGASVTCYLLLWGRLLPYSPIALGFGRKELDHVIVYNQVGNRFTDHDVESLIADVEAAHGLKFQQKPKVFFFADRDSYTRRTTTKARLCAYPPVPPGFNGAIVVSPWAQEEDLDGKIELKIYLTHELSHALLFQHMTVFSLLRFPRWLLEGMATYSANQMGTSLYPGKAETLTMIKEGNWLPPDLYETSAEDQIPLRVKYRKTFMYSEFACIVDDLVRKFGQTTYLQYMKELLSATDHDAVFKTFFGVEFSDYLVRFRATSGS